MDVGFRDLYVEILDFGICMLRFWILICRIADCGFGDLGFGDLRTVFEEKQAFPRISLPGLVHGARPASRLEGEGGVSASARRAKRVSDGTPHVSGAS